MQHRPELDRWILESASGSRMGAFLDLGCGVGRNGFLLWEEGFGSRRVGVELDHDYAARARSLGVYDEVIEADLRGGLPDFESSSFETILCTDVLGNLEREHAVELLDECERIAKERVVITVATGHPVNQSTNPLEEHRSTWTARELRQRGYRVRGFGSRLSTDRHGGRRFLYGWYGGTLLAHLSPRFAEELLAVREL